MRILPALALATALASLSIPVSAQSLILKEFNAQSNSGETGLVSITPNAGGDGITVNVSVVGEPAGAVQPMHIHTGSCGPSLGGVYKPLQNLVDGHSVTNVAGVTISDLERGTYAINIHKGPGPLISTYVACADISKAH
jgi:hypothetical protein